jgi:hypothetical protein
MLCFYASPSPLSVMCNCGFFLYYSCIQTQVKPVLDKLNVDSDVDVKYFASEAIAGIAGK